MRIDHVAPVFHVADVDASIAFYRDILGFAEDFRFGAYVGLKMEGFSLHLSQSDARERPLGGGNVYVFCDDSDAYFAARIAGKPVDLVQPPCTAPYGMRDFIIKDPDGNQLSFGHDK